MAKKNPLDNSKKKFRARPIVEYDYGTKKLEKKFVVAEVIKNCNDDCEYETSGSDSRVSTIEEAKQIVEHLRQNTVEL